MVRRRTGKSEPPAGMPMRRTPPEWTLDPTYASPLDDGRVSAVSSTALSMAMKARAIERRHGVRPRCLVGVTGARLRRQQR
jgi:hypothetical protein